MDFELSSDQKRITQTVRSFVDEEMIPVERDASGDAGIGADLLHNLQAKSHKTGLWAPDVPETYGGLGVDTTTLLLFEMELLRCLLPAAQPLEVFGVGWPKGVIILSQGTEEQKKRYLYPVLAGERAGCFCLTEPGVGSDAAHIETTATRVGDSYVVNGRKSLIGYEHNADF